MHLLVRIKPPVEETVEGVKPYPVRLLRMGRDGHIVVHLVEDDATYYRQHEKDDHHHDIVCASRAYGPVDETAAEPDHQQSAPYPEDAGNDADQRIPLDPVHPVPDPTQIFHAQTVYHTKVSKIRIFADKT